MYWTGKKTIELVWICSKPKIKPLNKSEYALNRRENHWTGLNMLWTKNKTNEPVEEDTEPAEKEDEPALN